VLVATGTASAPAALLIATAATFPACSQAPDPIRPDPQLTPGATVVVDKDALCTPGYARGVRYVPSDVHRAVFRAYSLVGLRTHDYEIDHLMALSLGGSNDPANLWPQSRRTRPWNAGTKDALEVRLHELVCWGGYDLHSAQEAIRADWIAAYQRFVGPEPRPRRQSSSD
jgi:hypothetical protein